MINTDTYSEQGRFDKNYLKQVTNVVLDTIPIHLSRYIKDTTLLDGWEVETERRHLANEIVYSLIKYCTGKQTSRKETYIIPKNWWRHLLYTIFNKYKKYFPNLHKEYEDKVEVLVMETRICPHLPIQDKVPHIVWMINGDLKGVTSEDMSVLYSIADAYTNLANGQYSCPVNYRLIDEFQRFKRRINEE